MSKTEREHGKPETVARARRVDELCDAFEAAWRAGGRPRIEDYLDMAPRSDRATLLGELLAAEWEVRRAMGEQVESGEYLARFRDHIALVETMWRETGHDIWPTTYDLGTFPSVPVLPQVPGYTILAELGRGGMGAVYKARQTALERLVALKMILAGDFADAEAAARFRVEATTIARLKHPNIVQIHAVGEHDGRAFIELEYVAGGSLAQWLDGIPWPVDRAARFISALASAMGDVHRLGIVHRDLKPANILLADDRTPKIADFGLAKLHGRDGSLTHTEAILGSPSYMAPEQAEGKAREATPPADVYALGAILYELLTGRPPFCAATALETLQQVRSLEPVSPRRLLPQLPRDLETICLKCLDKLPERRYSNGGELAAELNRFLGHQPIVARATGLPTRLARFCRRHRSVAIASAVAAVAVLASLVLLLALALVQSAAARRLGAALNESRRLSASLIREQGIALCEQGDVDRGLLWLVRGLAAARATGDAELERIVRADIAGWSRRIHHLQARLEHAGPVRTIATSPDAKFALTGSDDGTARLWNVATGEPIGSELPHPRPVLAVALSRDGHVLLTLAEDGVARIWKAGSNPPSALTLPHPGTVVAAALSPDGRTCITGGADGTARLWDTKTANPLGAVMTHKGPVKVVVFDAPGQRVLTGSSDGSSRLWDARTGEPLGPPLVQSEAIRSAAFSLKGDSVITGSDDFTAVIWNARTGRAVAPPLRHEARVEALAFSPDGKLVITGSRDWRTRLWDAHTGALREPVIHHQAPVVAVAFSADSRTALSGSKDGTAIVLDATTGKTIGPPIVHAGEVLAVALSPDAGTAFLAGLARTANVWHLEFNQTQLSTVSHDDWIAAEAFSPDGRLVVTCNENHAQLWEAATGRVVGPPLHHDALVRCAAFTPSGDLLVTGGEDRTTRVWNVSTQSPVGRPLMNEGIIYSAAISPDGRLLLTGTHDGVLSLWELSSGRRLATRAHHLERVLAVAFSPDAARFASSGTDQKAQIWNTSRFEPIGPSLRHQGQVWTVTFSPDGRILATGSADKSVRLWDANRGTPLGSPLVERRGVRTAVFSPDGQSLFAGTIGDASRLWDLATRKPIGAPLGHLHYPVLAVWFDKTGNQVLAGLEDESIHLYDLPKPIRGSIPQVAAWCNVITNMKLDAEGGVSHLEPSEWRDSVQKLQQAGGSPLP
jgi:WD40 repeat protein